MLLGLVKHVPDAACPYTHKHFDEVGAGNTKERDFSFAGNGARQKCFTGTGAADH